ncbi:NBAS subunit of NRZ tethering complex-like [Scylla paramamosain]|uniref:NBAS subunit of NRZ tethering complex-like n=1 Tax=Scylla paramamosain TaxID=85552 RepID=UPI003082FBFE
MNWMQPLVEVSLGEEQYPVDPQQETNTDFQKQGCHAFYADLFQEPHISGLGISYQSYAPPSLSSPALEFSLTLLRIALLEETFSLGATGKANKTVLVEAARGVLKEDLAMGLLLLLSLREVEEARAVLAALPRTDVSLQVTQYYAALQLYTRLHPWTQPGIAPAFLHPPQDVIAAVAAAVDSGATTRLGQETEPLVELFRATQGLVEDYMQGQALRRLGAGVDMARFLADAGYKEDTVLGLALTLEAEVLELAVALAKKYQVSLWEVNMAHLQHLFSSGLETEEVRQRVAEQDLVTTLSERPDDFTTRMEETVLPAIDGKDLDRLLLYYTLLESSTQGASEQQAASHVRLLKKLKGAANGLDYKLLLQPDSDPLETLRPVLTAGNVGVLAKAVQGVPGRGGAGLEPSTVYCAWAQKHFFDLPKEHKLKTVSDWVHRYEACGEYLQKMTAQDALKFLRQLVLSETGASKVPLEARAEMTRRALKFCRQQQSKQKFTEDEEGWMLQQSDDPRLRDYARRFAQTGGDEKELQCVACAVLLEGGELGLLQEVLAVFPEQAATTPEDIMVQTLKQLLAQWRTGAHQMSLPEGRSQVSVLDHLLLQVHTYLEEGGELLAEEEVLEEVRELCGDEEVALEARVEVLTVAEKHLSLSEEDLQLVRVMRTGGVVAGAWPGEVVAPEQLASSEARAALLTSLAASTSSPAQAKALVHLLNLWPPFDAQEYNSMTTNPWLTVLNKVVEVTQDDPAGLQVVWEAAQQAHSLGQLSGECLAELVGTLQGLGRGGLRCCCKVALLSPDPEVHRAVVEGITALEEVTEADYDGELLNKIVSQGLVTPLVSTPLYGPLVTHLVESADPDAVEQAVEQLSEAGHPREAASLACRTTSLPRTLLTAAAALKTYRRWL